MLSGDSSATVVASPMSAHIPGLSRIDADASRTHGWYCRVGSRIVAGKRRARHAAYFGDQGYGGKAAARQAAERWLARTRNGAR